MPDSTPRSIPERPLIRGERVWLRPMEEGDLPAYAAGINDTEIGGWAGYRWPLSTAMASEWLVNITEQGKKGDGFFFAVCELGDDRFIGTTWLKNLNPVDGNAELAIYMDRDHTGSGWGTDAQRALLAFGFGSLGLERVSLMVSATNARAIRSYEKVGFQREGLLRRAFRLDGVLQDIALMAILRDEWEAASAARP